MMHWFLVVYLEICGSQLPQVEKVWARDEANATAQIEAGARAIFGQ